MRPNNSASQRSFYVNLNWKQRKRLSPLKSQKCHTPCCKHQGSHCALMAPIVMLSCPLWYKGAYYDVWPFVCAFAYWIFYKNKYISLFLSLDKVKYSHRKPAQKNNATKTNINQFWKKTSFHICLFVVMDRRPFYSLQLSGGLKWLIERFIFSNVFI